MITMAEKKTNKFVDNIENKINISNIQYNVINTFFE